MLFKEPIAMPLAWDHGLAPITGSEKGLSEVGIPKDIENAGTRRVTGDLKRCIDPLAQFVLLIILQKGAPAC
jgi:hypothetical protein